MRSWGATPRNDDKGAEACPTRRMRKLTVEAANSLFGDRVLFALRAQDAIDRVGRATRGLVIVPNLHFTEKSHSQHVEAGEEQNGSKDHQRAVLHEQIGLMEELFLN